MTKELVELEKQLEALDEKIKETKKRLPAHSTKPPVMIDLLELEDKYDAVYEKIRAIKEHQ